MANRLTNVAALLAMLAVGIASGIADMMYLFDTMPLTDQSTVPENAVGIVILPFLIGVLSLFIVVIFTLLIFGSNKKVRPSLLLFHRNDSKVCMVFRSIGYLIIARLIYEGIRDFVEYKKVFITGLCSYAGNILFVVIGLMIFMSIITKYEENIYI